MKLIALKVVLPSAVRRRWRDERVDAKPFKCKQRRTRGVEHYKCARKIVQVFDRMHCETGEGFHVCVSVVKTVNEVVETLYVLEPVSKVEMYVAVHWHRCAPHRCV